MKYSTFYASEMLAGVASLLELNGFDTDDQTIALGMEAPYLFVHEDSCYRAGASLYHPRWINLYLNRHGFHLHEHTLPKEKVSAFLRNYTPALLYLALNGRRMLALYSGYADKRYHLALVQSSTSETVDSLALTAPSLKRRLPEEVTLYTLTSCEIRTVDFSPLLVESLRTLTAYQQDLLQLREQTVSREDMPTLHKTILRALMTDMLPMAALSDDLTLAEELRLLNHDYRHLFTVPGQQTVLLSDRLPKTSIRNCIAWIKEDIRDRLHTLGVTDELLDSVYHI